MGADIIHHTNTRTYTKMLARAQPQLTTLKCICIIHTNFWNYYMCDNYDEFCKSAESATKNGPRDTFPLYGSTLKYDSEGIYNDGTKIAQLDLKLKTIQQLNPKMPWSRTQYKYAVHMLKKCYGFREVPSSCELIHVQHLSYDDHT